MPGKWSSKFELKPGSWVFVPTAESIDTGRRIKKLVESFWTPPKNYFHLQNGGHVKALRSHLHHAVFVHLDIKDFFGSINRSRVTRCLKGRVGYKQARELANSSTVLHPTDSPARYILPFGFVQSPIIASLCLYESSLGRAIQRIKHTRGATVSVYVDDIIVSSNSYELSQQLVSILKLAATKSNFRFNLEKEEGPCSKVTAFNIELSEKSLFVEPERLREFVADYQAADSEDKKQGIRGYIKSINFLQAASL